jgi:hypothetical protein
MGICEKGTGERGTWRKRKKRTGDWEEGSSIMRRFALYHSSKANRSSLLQNLSRRRSIINGYSSKAGTNSRKRFLPKLVIVRNLTGLLIL